MKKLYIFILSIFLLTACSTTHFIKNDQTSYIEVNQKLNGKKVTILVNNGEEIFGSNVFVKSDSTSVDEISIPTANINKITKTNHSLGAVGGAIIGAIAGAGLGLIYDYVRNIKVRAPYIEFNIMGQSRSERGFLSTKSDGESAVIGGIIGMCAGALIGGFNGPTDNFIFSQSEIGDSTQVANLKVK